MSAARKLGATVTVIGIVVVAANPGLLSTAATAIDRFVGSNGLGCGDDAVVTEVRSLAQGHKSPSENSLYATALGSSGIQKEDVVHPGVGWVRPDLDRQIKAAEDACHRRFGSYDYGMTCSRLRGTKTPDQLKQSGDAINRLSASDIQYWYDNFWPVYQRINAEEARSTKEYDEKVADFDKRITYGVGLIRLQRRDETTGKISCAAKLTINAPSGSWSKDVKYTIEPTTDGDAYIQLYGLSD
ncbi:hypothetical protein [Bradyrhizobium vignae]|uniref:hypothetical protein n=1 Tax=Bradyrhizobium vignae TaxID=1549949 RepID=UPI00100B2177|nr:hypothetical protein [Bradyrhizobium vignae]RXG87488.1 hypothetical protein EAV90_32270 [Bradyrhizobium vignae]